MDPSKNNIMEIDNIALLRYEWSASFSTFHQVTIVDKEEGKVDSYMICETDEPVE